MKKWLILIILCVLGLLVYKYLYQNHRDIANETSIYSLSALDISNEFAVNPVASESKYLNKTIEISGVVTNYNSNNLTLNENVFCLFSKNIQIEFLNNSQIKIKGRFIGYDDLLEQIKLDQCNIIN
ncbi:MAG: hypothetical protein ACI9OE_000373 [Mariniflexile sp.]|jgi:hypothetical protein